MSQADAAPAPGPRRRGWLGTGVQLLAGVGLGLSLAKTLQLPEEQVALIGTVITLVTWLADEALRLPDKDTRWGAFVHGALRFLALVGFIMALQSLAALNGLTR